MLSENSSGLLLALKTQSLCLFKFFFDFHRPLKTLPKQYQPLPPEPKTSSQFFHTRKALSQAHTFPISAKVTRYACIPHPHSPRTKTLASVKPQGFTSITPLLLHKKKKEIIILTAVNNWEKWNLA